MDISYCDETNVPRNNDRGVIEALLNTKIVGIYWYFIVLFGLYLIIPVLAAIPNEKRKGIFSYAIGVMLLLNVTLPLLFSLRGRSYNMELTLPVGGYCIYLMLGYCLDRYPIKRNVQYMIYLAGAIGLLVHIIGTYRLSCDAGQIVQTYKGYTNLPCIVYSAAVFTLFRYMNGKRVFQWVKRLCRPFVGKTLGIYLIHWYLLDRLYQYAPSVVGTEVTKYIPAGVGIFLASAGITAALQKIPLLNRTIPQ